MVRRYHLQPFESSLLQYRDPGLLYGPQELGGRIHDTCFSLTPEQHALAPARVSQPVPHAQP